MIWIKFWQSYRYHSRPRMGFRNEFTDTLVGEELAENGSGQKFMTAQKVLRYLFDITSRLQTIGNLGSTYRRIGDAFAAGFDPAGVALLVTGYAFDVNPQIVPSVIFAERNGDLGVRGR